MKGMKWPTLEEASHFSIEGNEDYIPRLPPFGFHKMGFGNYVATWGWATL